MEFPECLYASFETVGFLTYPQEQADFFKSQHYGFSPKLSLIVARE